MQEDLHREIEALKGNQSRALSRPGTATAEVAALREDIERVRREKDEIKAERDQLAIENRSLQSQIAQQSSQVKGLLGTGSPASAAPTSGQTKALQGKLKHYEKALAAAEKERSELKTRATMAETQNKALQEHLGQ